MPTYCDAPESRREGQFGLLALFEYVTICAVNLAMSRVVGVLASVTLMLLALALWARRGLIALAMLMAALLAVDWPKPLYSESTMAGQAIVIVLAGALCAWYCLRRRRMEKAHIP